MTVKELIEELLEKPQNMEVKLSIDGEEFDIVNVFSDRVSILIVAEE